MDAGVQECMYHVALCQEKSQGIKGRDDIIDVSLFLFYLMVYSSLNDNLNFNKVMNYIKQDLNKTCTWICM
jgi:hypothetical protein